MKTELALIALLTLAGVALFFQQETNQQDGDLYQQFQEWKMKFNFVTNDGSEDEYRFAVWSENYKFVQEYNASKQNLQLAMNQFAAFNVPEYKARLLNRTPSGRSHEKEETNVEYSYPADVNWVNKGVVAPIKDQGNCGSCWAFSAVTSLESLHAIQTGNLVQFSEQQVCSCDKWSFGCNGGNEYTAMSRYTPANGLETEADYPYVQKTNPKTAACQYNSSKVVWKNTSAKNIAAKNPDAMKTVLANQPISVAIDAGNIYFQLYSSGILSTANCGTSLDHAVALEGYNTSGSSPYWILRNSWGTSWGQKGYAWFAIVSGAGVCGVQLEPCYPTA